MGIKLVETKPTRFVRFRDMSGYVRTGDWTESGIESGGQIYDPEEVNILPPVDPSKIICLYGNYVEHLRESGYSIPEDMPERPQFFLKSPNTITGHRVTITLPSPSTEREDLPNLGDIETGKGRIDYEAELGVVIGDQCKRVPEENAGEVIWGFTCVNDLSNRDDQSIEHNWVRGKSFDNAAPIGPVIAPFDSVPKEPRVRLKLNGNMKQDSKKDQFVFSVSEVIAEITELITLEAGDVIAMGTPSGVGPISEGDTTEVIIEGVGTLENHFEER